MGYCVLFKCAYSSIWIQGDVVVLSLMVPSSSDLISLLCGGE